MSRIGRIYRVSGRRLGIGVDHDVVVVGESTEGGTVRVKTVTSLEHVGKSGKVRYDFKALEQAKKGIVVPLPISVIGSRHWSGIHMKGIVVNDSDLRERKVCKEEKLPGRWLKVIR